jgi:predicted Zn-dependent protease
MKLHRHPISTACCCFLLGVGLCLGQQSRPQATVFERARQAFLAGRYPDAERAFRELTKLAPSNILFQFYLGNSLFKQEKYAEAIQPYETTRKLDKSKNVLSLDFRRALTDQLAMSYGMGGQLAKARLILEDAIRNDPEYPFNYYNLACAFAEMGKLEKTLTNLSLAFQHKNHVIEGEHLPDPRADSSFKRYVQDPQFVKLMREIGYE